jgi:universal stress protein A
MANYKNLLVATDFHNNNLPVVHKAANIAKIYNAELHVVSIVPNVPYYMASGLASLSDVEDNLEAGSKARLDEVRDALDENVKCHIAQGSAKIEISRIAKEIKADLIVVGSHGRHGFQRVLGSTASGVLHRAKCDVLVVRVDFESE